jgi:glycosyltransferase involved in cell wall biosynthesis
MSRKLRIAIDCRIEDSNQGVGTALVALAKALSDSDSPDQDYTFIVRENLRGWLEPYVFGPCKLEGIPESGLSQWKSRFRWIAPLRYVWKKLRNESARMPTSDGYVESHQFDVVHFPTQAAYLTGLPTIFQPWDLQHLHYPGFFSKAEYGSREKLYRAFCAQASVVCVQTQWTRQDIINQYNIAGEKVVVIPWGPVFDAYRNPSAEEVRTTIEKYQLPDRFFFYPAVTWPHKNHEAILRALEILKNKDGIAAHVFFTGASTEHRQVLDKLARELGVTEQLHFLGFVTPTELQSIFRAATAMIFPSKFEGFGLPILEAFHAGLPVLASNASTLPEVAKDGALFFDPDSPSELSGLMKTILEKPELRQDLKTKGTLVLSEYSIGKMAASFQTLYAKTAALSSVDHRLPPVSAKHG